MSQDWVVFLHTSSYVFLAVQNDGNYSCENKYEGKFNSRTWVYIKLLHLTERHEKYTRVLPTIIGCRCNVIFVNKHYIIGWRVNKHRHNMENLNYCISMMAMHSSFRFFLFFFFFCLILNKKLVAFCIFEIENTNKRIGSLSI